MHELSQQQLDQLEVLFQELIAWNEHTNITAITNKEEVVVKHFTDALTLLDIIPPGAKNIIDIGSGAGFPGIPLKIARPDMAITLVEAVGKKVEFSNHVISKLNLKNIEAVQARAEELGHDKKYREQFDVAVARAVASLPIVLEYSLPFVKVGGIFIAQKSKGDEEINQSGKALAALGGKIIKTIPINVTGLEDRQLIIVEKQTPTPQDYPRRTGVPHKKPL